MDNDSVVLCMNEKHGVEMHQNLPKYRYNRYSQNGEDGVIEEICLRLGIIAGWFVEFGAWDGKHLSNNYNLVSNHGWHGVYIEADPVRYESLLLTKAAFPERLHTLCARVGWEGENRLERLPAQTPLPADFDLLSIDIDSYDWQVWNSLSRYQPKIVVIECNSVLPPGVPQLHSPPKHNGASFSSLVELGARKGYRLVCHTGNCFFIRNKLVARLRIDESNLEPPEKLFNYPKHYRERILAVGRRILPQKIMNLVLPLPRNGSTSGGGDARRIDLVMRRIHEKTPPGINAVIAQAFAKSFHVQPA